MISFDTNVLFAGIMVGNANYEMGAEFLESLKERNDVVISEFVLTELYGLLRNPAILRKPLSETAAVDYCELFRHHERWQLVGFSADSRAFHDAFWPQLREKDFARRRAYDWRMALSLTQQGVREFATANLKDFRDFGFSRVWNPLLK
jgi:predicted nucleic acid-binding protein